LSSASTPLSNGVSAALAAAAHVAATIAKAAHRIDLLILDPIKTDR
jgi:hypothetical protein